MKKIKLFLLCAITTSFCWAQEIEWQNTIGGSSDDVLGAIFSTMDGGSLIGGSSSSNISGDKTENSYGGNDYWIIKLDASLSISWQKTIGGSFGDNLSSVIETKDGGFLCGGSSNSPISGNKTDSSFGDYDFWIVQLDESGNILWQKIFGGTNGDFLYSVSQTDDNGFICGGHSSSNISGNKTENVCGGSDYWIVKLDSVGNIQWQNTIGGSGDEWLLSVEQASDGGYVCGGTSSSSISCDKSEALIGGDDYWIVKLDSSGNIEWENAIGGNSYDELYSITATNDGGFICAGTSPSGISGDKTVLS